MTERIFVDSIERHIDTDNDWEAAENMAKRALVTIGLRPVPDGGATFMTRLSEDSPIIRVVVSDLEMDAPSTE